MLHNFRIYKGFITQKKLQNDKSNLPKRFYRSKLFFINSVYSSHQFLTQKLISHKFHYEIDFRYPISILISTNRSQLNLISKLLKVP